MRVSGQVTVGGEPAGFGLLTWMPEEAAGTPAVIINRDTALGVRQQQTFGGGRPQVDVEVGGGFFQSDELRPGRWQVHWIPADGSLSPPEAVELPESDDYELQLAFGGLALTGVVVDEDDRPVAGARVRAIAGSALAFSDADGSFRLIGLTSGRHRLQARFETRTSDVAEAVVSPDGDSQDVLLRIREQAEAKIEVVVLGDDGEAAAGAFVFVEGPGQNGRILTTDLAGKAATSLDPPYPERVRVATVSDGRWTFGQWLDLDQAREGVTLATSSTGTLHLTSAERTGVPAIRSEDGWDLTRLLTRIGVRPVVDPYAPLEIRGLPAGRYFVDMGGSETAVAVRADDRAEVEFP